MYAAVMAGFRIGCAIVNKPHPLFLVKQNFLPEKMYYGLKDALPDFEQVTGVVRSTRDLYYKDAVFQAMMRRPGRDWYNLTWWLATRSFWDPYLRWFRPAWKGRLLHDPLKLPIAGFDRYLEVRNGCRKDEKQLFLYPRIDIGWGGVGYGINNGGHGVHVDMPQRIISVLFYFSSQAGMEGGEFEIYQDPETLYDRIPISENMAIFSLQAKEAWHRVRPVTKVRGHRIAAYIALSCSQRIWADR